MAACEGWWRPHLVCDKAAVASRETVRRFYCASGHQLMERTLSGLPTDDAAALLSIRELKCLMEARGISTAGCIERSELLWRLKLPGGHQRRLICTRCNADLLRSASQGSAATLRRCTMAPGKE